MNLFLFRHLRQGALLTLSLLVTSTLSYGQFYNDNAKFTVQSSGVLYVDTSVTTASNGYFWNSGDIYVTGDWINNSNSGALDPTGGAVYFDGNRNQNITGTDSTTFYDLYVHGSGVKRLQALGINDAGAVAYNSLTFQTGILELNSRTFRLKNGNATALSRTGGFLRSETHNGTPNPEYSIFEWDISNNTGTYLIPFGDSSGTYLPFTYDITTGGSTGGDLKVSTYHTSDANKPYPDDSLVTNMNNPNNYDNSDTTLNRFWRIDTRSYSTNPTADITFTWNDPRDFPPGLTDEYEMMAHRWWKANSKWEAPIEGTVNTSTDQLTINNINKTRTWWTLAPFSDPFAMRDTICEGESTTLHLEGGSLGEEVDWYWYEGSCGGSLVGTGNSVSVSPTSQKEYYVRAEGNGYVTTCDTVIITVGTNSTAASSISSTPDTICLGDTSTLSVNGGSLGLGAEWQWYKGSCGGTFVDTGLSIYVSPQSDVTYYVRAESMCDTTSCVNKTVYVYPEPTADFGATQVCQGDTTDFTDSSSIPKGSITSWDWSFGDGDTSDLQNPSHYYTSSGSYNVTLVVTSDNGCQDDTTQSIRVDSLTSQPDQPSGDTVVCEGTIHTYGIPPVPTAVTYDWTVPPGATIVSGATTDTIDVQFGANSGDICVRSQNSCDTSSYACQSITVNVKPTADAGNDTSICNRDTITLGSSPTASGGNSPYNYTWAPNQDISNTTASNPDAYPDTTTTYGLTVTDANNCPDEDSVTISVQSRTADFTATQPCFPVTQFSDQSSVTIGSINAWDWQFGDGDTSDQQDPSHKYDTAQTYNVQLAITTNLGCQDTISKSIDIHPKPEANFGATNVCYPDTTQFTDSSTVASGSLDSWNWNFDDGNTDTLQNPPHQYDTSGGYNVQLVVTTDQNCKDTVNKNVVVDPKPTADFIAQKRCLPDTTSFIDQTSVASGSVTGWDWQFGDGNGDTIQNPDHKYDTTGTYAVTLKVGTDQGCRDTVIKNISLHNRPKPVFTSNSPVCYLKPINFSDSSFVPNDSIVQWDWKFGDSDTSNLTNPTHYYDTSGAFDVTLITTTDKGCADSTENTVTIHPKPTAAFSAKNHCYQDTTQFFDQSTISSGNVTGWDWNFGDGDSATIQNPKHYYDTTGSYTVELIASSDQNCKDTTQQPWNIYARPQARFTAGKICEGDSTHFTDSSTISEGLLNYWYWEFDDGDTSFADDPTHLYDSAGTYNATLYVGSDKGCIDSMTKPITVWALPDIIAGPDTSIPRGASSLLYAKGGQRYHWMPAKGLSDTTTATPVASPDYTTDYRVIGTDSNGCQNVDSVHVDVIQEFEIYIPNTFTPNNDGVNDILYVEGRAVKEIKFQIYDRWGQLVFETENMNKGWDGTRNGNRAEVGTYAYYLRAESILGETMTKKGTISLVR